MHQYTVAREKEKLEETIVDRLGGQESKLEELLLVVSEMRDNAEERFSKLEAAVEQLQQDVKDLQAFAHERVASLEEGLIKEHEGSMILSL